MFCFKQGGIPQRSVALLALGCPIGAMSEATFGLGVKVRLGRSQQRTAGGLVAWGLAFPLPESPKRSASDRARRGGGGAAWSFPFQQHCSGQLALYCVSGCLHFKQDLARRGRPPCVLLDALRWLSVKGGLTEPRLFSGAGLERKKLAVLKVWLLVWAGCPGARTEPQCTGLQRRGWVAVQCCVISLLDKVPLRNSSRWGLPAVCRPCMTRAGAHCAPRLPGSPPRR